MDGDESTFVENIENVDDSACRKNQILERLEDDASTFVEDIENVDGINNGEGQIRKWTRII